jgi:hypothetical protein
LEIEFKQTKAFFDRPAVIRAIGRAEAAYLSRAGAFVQRRARSSIRRRKKPSAPGQPPSAHSKRNPSLKTILFAFESKRESVIVGPVKLNQVEFAIQGTTTVPSRLEFGGGATIREERYRNSRSGTWFRRDGRRRVDNERKEYRTRRVTYAKRPFMGPALKAEAKNFPDLWANAIKT